MNLNENELEKILRHPPRPKAPAGLKQKLHAKINLATKAERASVVAQNDSLLSWLRRWWPALAPATASLACIAVMVAQQIEARDLRQSNEVLAKQIAQENADAATKSSDKQNGAAALDVSAAEQEEMARLKERVSKLGGEVVRLEAMQKENQTLRSQPQTSPAGLSQDELDAVAKAKERAQSIACINNLKQIGLAVRVWANDSQEINPPNFLSMSNELNTPKILVCPADTNRVAATTFANYTDANCSYEYLTPSATNADREPLRVLTRCPIHGHIGLCDGSVQGEVAKKHPQWLLERDNKLYFNARAVEREPLPSNP